MSETFHSIPLGEVPIAGDTGHIAGKRLRSKNSQIETIEKLKNMAAGGCPVNRKVPTKMSRDSFVIACKKFKQIADKDRNNKNKYAISTPQGFRTSNRRVCIGCEIGRAVAKGQPFKPPLNITFTVLTDLVKRKPRNRKNPKPKKIIKKVDRRIRNKPAEKGVKLTQSDVIRIRKMYQEGYSVTGLCEILPVTASTMYRVVNRESWKDV